MWVGAVLVRGRWGSGGRGQGGSEGHAVAGLVRVRDGRQ